MCEECPQFLTLNTESTAVLNCVNCQKEGLVYFEENCYYSHPVISVLVDQEFNAYKRCKDVSKFIDLGCFFEKQILDNSCKRCKGSNQLLHNGRCVDSCPYNAAVDFTNSFCKVCKEVAKYLSRNQSIETYPLKSNKLTGQNLL